MPPILLAGFTTSSYANEDHYGGIFFSHIFLENRDGGLYANRAVGSLHNKYGYVSGRTIKVIGTFTYMDINKEAAKVTLSPVIAYPSIGRRRLIRMIRRSYHGEPKRFQTYSLVTAGCTENKPLFGPALDQSPTSIPIVYDANACLSASE